MNFVYDEDDGFGIALSDVLIGFAAVLLVHFAPVNKDSDQSTQPGSICVDLIWPNDRNVDVDLWAQAPDKLPVGYSSPHAPYLDLLKDVISFSNNPSHINYEITCGKSLVQGEWTFNAHYYGKHDDGPDNIPVEMNVYIKNGTEKNQTVKSAKTVLKPREQKTLIALSLDANGRFVEGSLNHRYVEVRK